jgi:hypothetical protein
MLVHMTRALPSMVWPLLARLLWVSLGCWLLFVAEKFAYNVFDLGVGYHKKPTMFLWLLLLPWLCYWFFTVRSPLLATRRRAIRVAVFGLTALLLAVGFFYASVMVFWTVAKWSGVQFW